MSFKTIDASSQRVMMIDLVDLLDKNSGRKRSMVAIQHVSEDQKEKARIKN